ncbi:MAG: hypothetical protein IH613_17210 [Desulfuromonadales bacterium]|nr:hypothetical protein [Desulfuromonadales bacterium]
MSRIITCVFVLSCLLIPIVLSGNALAASSEQIETILQRLDALEQENTFLKQRVRDLGSQLQQDQGKPNGLVTPAPVAATKSPQDALDAAIVNLPEAETKEESRDLAGIDLGKSARLRLIDVSLDVLTTVGASSERDESLETLQGGGHDPKRRGFTLQQAELSLIGAVDPYFQAEAHILASEDTVELEEAFVQSTALPWGLELEAGYFLTEFGRINPSHPHAWVWLDQPIVNTRLFGGEGMRGAGVRMSKLLPVPWYSVFHVGAQNADGEFMTSFLGGESSHDHGNEEPAGDGHAHELGIGGRPLVDLDVRNLGDLVYLARWENAIPLSSTWTSKFGLSGLYGPNFTGTDGETWIYGADALFKWVPEKNERGRPFLRIEGEISKRDLDADAFFDEDEGELIPSDTLEDWGAYVQALYGFPGRWATGLRYEYASGSGNNLTHEGEYPARDDDPFRNDRTRISPLVIFSPSEFTRIRLQYNYDEADHLDDPAHSVWLGLEVLIGAHPAHTY